MNQDLSMLKAQYDGKSVLHEQLCQEIRIQVEELLHQQNTPLAFPIETRVKSWSSIEAKCMKDGLSAQALEDIHDIAGLRIVLLFKRDQECVSKIIGENFKVLNVEDTLNRLSADQFGYGSIHFDVEPKEEWLSIPTMKNLRGLRAEIQIRTVSQHMWAAVSHNLQYKRESDIPVSVRRSINRVAALLELVDLEFDRVLSERLEYVAKLDDEKYDERLNADVLAKILAEVFPAGNLDEDGEDYSRLLNELSVCHIKTARQLRHFVTKHLDAVMEKERLAIAGILGKGKSSRYRTSQRRIKKGVFYTFVGLTRGVLQEEFGKDYRMGSQEGGGKKKG